MFDLNRSLNQKIVMEAIMIHSENITISLLWILCSLETRLYLTSEYLQIVHQCLFLGMAPKKYALLMENSFPPF